MLYERKCCLILFNTDASIVTFRKQYLAGMHKMDRGNLVGFTVHRSDPGKV